MARVLNQIAWPLPIPRLSWCRVSIGAQDEARPGVRPKAKQVIVDIIYFAQKDEPCLHQWSPDWEELGSWEAFRF